MLKNIFLLGSCLILLSGCYSLKKRMEGGAPYNQQIHWPEGQEPEQAPFYLHNRIAIDASPEKVWALLIDAETWPDWYPGMKNVKVLDQTDGVIRADSELQFNTMNRDFDAEVIEYVPNERLTWVTNHPKIKAVHAWLIIPTDTGSLVVTDETQSGALANLQKLFLPNKLRNLHDVWLSNMKIKAESSIIN